MKIKKSVKNITFIFSLFILFSEVLFSNSLNILNKESDKLYLSNHIYDTNKDALGKKIEGTDFILVKYENDNISGFTAGVYRNSLGETIVSFGGTTADERNGNHDPLQTALSDVITDLQLLDKEGSEPKQFEKTREFLNNISDKEYTITGHSLGGSLAQYAGKYKSKKVTTFNTAPFTINQEAVSKLPFLNIGYDTNNMISNIRTKDDPLTLFVAMTEKIEKIKQINDSLARIPHTDKDQKEVLYKQRESIQTEFNTDVNIFKNSNTYKEISSLLNADKKSRGFFEPIEVKDLFKVVEPEGIHSLVKKDVIKKLSTFWDNLEEPSKMKEFISFIKRDVYQLKNEDRLVDLIQGNIYTLDIETGHGLAPLIEVYKNIVVAKEEIVEEKNIPVLSEGKEEEKLEAIYLENPNINDNKDEEKASLNKNQKKFDNIEDDIKDDKRVISKKIDELKKLERKLDNTDEYITKNKTNSSREIDSKKNKSYILMVWAYEKLKENRTKKNFNEFKKYADKLTNNGIKIEEVYAILESGDKRKLFDSYVVNNTTTYESYQVYNKDYRSLQNDIADLIKEIKSKNKELTKDILKKDNLEIVVENLSDDINNDNKLAISNDSKPSLDPGYWQGTYIGNYYSENHLGEPLLNGWTDSRSRTKDSKPDKNVKLYLHENGNFSNWENAPVRKTITLDSSSSAYLGDYKYTAWGTWSDPNANNTANAKVYTSHWVVGQRIDSEDRPKTGSATYTGELLGIVTQINVANTTKNVNGNITLNANFGTQNMTGSLTVKDASSGAIWANASLNNTQMRNSNSMQNLVFDGQLTGTSISNAQSYHSQISGEFYGKQAAEAGGIWAITKGTGSNGDERATGVFRAKKQ